VTVAFMLVPLMLSARLSAQELDPRAYARAPIDSTFLIAGLAVSHGDVLTDPTLPVTDINATVAMPSLGVARSFALFGKTAQAFAALPYGWGHVTGKVGGDAASVDRAGLADTRLRLAVLVRGAPAGSVFEIAKAPRRLILGTSLTVSAPSGQFSPSKLINVGTNRWAFKPEFAVSAPLGDKWLLDAYAGLWLFTTNNTFYPGTAVRSQAQMGSFQGHLSYNFRPQLWAAFDGTYYVGGQTTIQGVANDDRQANVRLGTTLVLPVGRRHSIKLAVAKGAIVRIGSDFTIYSIAWQTAWISRSGEGQ
jgi:hypothetical protein